MIRHLLKGIHRRPAELRPLSSRFAKFALVGGTGVLVNTGTLALLYSWARLPLLLSSAIAVEAAIASNYYWNNRWTFSAEDSTARRFVQFNLVSLAGLAITSGTLYALVTFAGVHYILANLTGIGLATVWNFSVNSLWTWGSAG